MAAIENTGVIDPRIFFSMPEEELIAQDLVQHLDQVGRIAVPRGRS